MRSPWPATVSRRRSRPAARAARAGGGWVIRLRLRHRSHLRRIDGWRKIAAVLGQHTAVRSEEHTSELQSHHDLVCRLLLEKKKRTGHSARGDCKERNANLPG